MTAGPSSAAPAEHRLSVVVPVYRGELTLPRVVEELDASTTPFTTPDGHRAVVSEILLVHDHGPDGSAGVIRELAAAHPRVRAVWLSRNFGQHAATLAGMASSGGDWVATMDEDGQHDPAYLPAMLDVAMRERASLVYARPTNAPPHGLVRNTASRGAKRLTNLFAGRVGAEHFHSYRLVLGETARGVAAYAGAGVFLDVALGWVSGPAVTCPVPMREEGGRTSGYSLRTLMSHFWRMVLTSGTRLLRVVSVLGVLFAVGGVGFAGYLVLNRLFGGDVLPGWTSVMVALLISTGALLFSLGVVAEYVGVAVHMAMGRPLYLIVSDPDQGPLGWRPAGPAARQVEPAEPEPGRRDPAHVRRP